MYNPLEIREVFHLEFLRWLGRKLKAGQYALKGGVNMRFFFNSFRYSEDMDLDAKGIKVDVLKDIVMGILEAASFRGALKPFGIEEMLPPDMKKAKQTETTQRFKVHLLTASGEDLFTKVEFSRRGFKGEAVVQPVSDAILRPYRLAPLLVPHYDIRSSLTQKIEALASRAKIQARDVFDIFILSSQYSSLGAGEVDIDRAMLKKAHVNIFEISFGQFKDTVISYLSLDDQKLYDSESTWDEVRVRTADFIKGWMKGNA